MDSSVATRLQQTLHSSKWTLAAGVSTLALVALWRTSRFRESHASLQRLAAAASSDPSLLRKHTTFESYTTNSGRTYPKIRTFYKPHGNDAKLPADLPLLVFVHGLGGSASQFESLLTALINVAPCLAIDFPGCGLSHFAPDDPNAYGPHALAELLAAAISKFRDSSSGQKVVFISHSLGCSTSALLISSTSSLHVLLEDYVAGMIAVCPRGTFLSEDASIVRRSLSSMPILVFDMLRWFLARGGTHSRSVENMVGPEADAETRNLQLKYNQQSESAVFLRTLRSGTSATGLFGKDIWSGIKLPLFLIAGEGDTVTPAAEVEKITKWLTDSQNSSESEGNELSFPGKLSVPAAAGDAAALKEKIRPIWARKGSPNPPQVARGTVDPEDHTRSKHQFVLKTTILQKPAGHALMYTTATNKVVCGMIESFLAKHVDSRLGQDWQLKHLSDSGKWDVKNLQKWQAIDACSEPIGGLFRAMKTMREVDDEHCPAEFVKRFSKHALPTGVAKVIDISHETPVYRPQGLTDAGIDYQKFPTVSKEKPKAEEVDHFNVIIDKLREDHDSIPPATIGVHCHYGFNRTGFFIVCYLVERLGYKLQDAIEEFAEKRAPGIKHEHFINELFVRYAVKMERRDTVVR